MNTYKHGGEMYAIEHIMYRHASNSGFANVSRFAEGTGHGKSKASSMMLSVTASRLESGQTKKAEQRTASVFTYEMETSKLPSRSPFLEP
jgi:hypothetical protein